MADLSLFEKLDTIPAIISIFTSTIFALFTAPFRDTEKTPKSLFKYVALTGVRTLVTRTTTRQQHYLNPPTDDSYLAVCKKRNVKPHSEILEDGTRAHWIGNSNAEKLIINFHGGGYTMPASDAMVEFMFQVIDSLTAQGKNVACLFLSYDLAPSAIYPRQLQQGAALLQHVLTDLKFPPGNIILTGDSAGGNLITALLSHISHPHPSTTVNIAPIQLSAPLRGAVLISPWVEFDTSKPSFELNKSKDCLTVAALNQWSSAFLGVPYPHTGALDYYNNAITAPESWWKDLQVEDVLIVAAADEVLLDGVVAFEKKLSKGLGEDKVELFIAHGEYHDQPSIDVMLGYAEKDEGLQAKRVKTWIASKL